MPSSIVLLNSWCIPVTNLFVHIDLCFLSFITSPSFLDMFLPIACFFVIFSPFKALTMLHLPPLPLTISQSLLTLVAPLQPLETLMILNCLPTLLLKMSLYVASLLAYQWLALVTLIRPFTITKMNQLHCVYMQSTFLVFMFDFFHHNKLSRLPLWTILTVTLVVFWDLCWFTTSTISCFLTTLKPTCLPSIQFQGLDNSVHFQHRPPSHHPPRQLHSLYKGGLWHTQALHPPHIFLHLRPWSYLFPPISLTLSKNSYVFIGIWDM